MVHVVDQMTRCSSMGRVVYGGDHTAADTLITSDDSLTTYTNEAAIHNRYMRGGGNIVPLELNKKVGYRKEIAHQHSFYYDRNCRIPRKR